MESKVSFSILVSYCNEITHIAIIRVRHGPHKIVTSSFPAITSLGNVQAKINTLYVGGTLHQCYKMILVKLLLYFLQITYFFFKINMLINL